MDTKNNLQAKFTQMESRYKKTIFIVGGLCFVTGAIVGVIITHNHHKRKKQFENPNDNSKAFYGDVKNKNKGTTDRKYNTFDESSKEFHDMKRNVEHTFNSKYRIV